MASTESNYPTPNFVLSPHQQELLFAALNSNKPGDGDSTQQKTPQPSPPQQQTVEPSNMTSLDFDTSPQQGIPGLFPGEGAFGDYDYDLDNFGDFDLSGLAHDPAAGNQSSTTPDGVDGTTQEKRSLSEEDENDEHDDKRRGGDETSARKPGRKPLTSEPTSVSFTPTSTVASS